MQHYSFTVTLRFWHPSIDPDTITTQLGIKPKHSSKVGQPRITPKGTPLEGAYRESYWHAEPLWQGWRDSTDTEAENAILELLPRLTPHREFIQQLLATGGRALIEISSHSSGNYALIFPPELLSQCSYLGLSLAHDIYPVSQA
jgi:Domain of unknown function (DUF4279)